MSPTPPLPLRTLRALLDRLIPEDDFPGALNAGVEHYVVGQLAGDCATEAPMIASGLAQLDAETTAHGGNSFAALNPAQQDALLREIEAGRAITPWPDNIAPAAFFSRMVDLAHEGFYADPANGGNQDAASWQMIGYEPRMPSGDPAGSATKERESPSAPVSPAKKTKRIRRASP